MALAIKNINVDKRTGSTCLCALSLVPSRLQPMYILSIYISRGLIRLLETYIFRRGFELVVYPF